MKVTICSSIKNKELIELAQHLCEKSGIHCFFPDGKSVSQNLSEQDRKAALAWEHYDAIEKSDAVYFLIKDGYMGTSVKLELGYCIALRKPIFFSELTNDPAVDHYSLRVVPLEKLATIKVRE